MLTGGQKYEIALDCTGDSSYFIPLKNLWDKNLWYATILSEPATRIVL